MTQDLTFNLHAPGGTARFIASRSKDLAADLGRVWPNVPAAGLSGIEARAFLDGGQAWIFAVMRDGVSLGHGFGVVQRGRKQAGLITTVLPDAPGGPLYWEGLRQFVAKQFITELVVESVGFKVSGEPIPAFAAETSRIVNEHMYVIDLSQPEGSRKLSSNNRRNIARAAKAGVQAVDLPREQALAAHFALAQNSLNRREQRGESIALRSPEAAVVRVLSSGTGRLYQAGLDGQVLSSKVVFMLGRHAYYYDGGTSPEGMDLGASHFLMAHIISSLREAASLTLNMGIAAADKPGLIRFKEGFDPDLWIVQRVVSRHDSLYKLLRNLAANVLPI